MRFEDARDELIETLVRGGMTPVEARRKLHNWTTRIERRTTAYLAHHGREPQVDDVLEHLAVQFDDLEREARRVYGGTEWDGTPAPVAAYGRAASMVRRAKQGVH